MSWHPNTSWCAARARAPYVASHNEPSYQYRFLRVTPDSGEKLHPHNLFFGLERGKASGDVGARAGPQARRAHTWLQARDVLRRRPMILDDIVFAANQFPGLTLAELEEFRGSVYSFYETVFGVRMIRAEERLRAVAADGFAAAHLKVAQARRCFASTASRSRTATSRSSGAAACASPTASPTTTSSAELTDHGFPRSGKPGCPRFRK